MEEVFATENVLFGGFFSDVSGCLEVMRRTSSLAFGSGVLHALECNPDWDCKQLLFCLEYSNRGDGLVVWHEFLLSQGFSLGDNSQSNIRDGVKVR